ncbi:chaperone protein DnaJ-like [Ylistrum balloti]|uniref:chaperone protein DnaJ-like n=1 Tax=Ylistrum balloti TaxID=509963 RepID=UPI002905E648|nr:chaperone protein DnaJ-like [Ylistrum balloti]
MRIYNGAAALLVRSCKQWQHRGFLTAVRCYRSDYYDVLEVKKTASQKEIKSAYIHLSKKYHPDVSTQHNAQGKFTKVAEAYQVLGNSESRKSYDNSHYSSPIPGAQYQGRSPAERQHYRRAHSGVGTNNISEEEYFDIRRGIKMNQEDLETIVTPYTILWDMITVTVVLTIVVVTLMRYKQSINNNLIFPPSPGQPEEINKKQSKSECKERAKQLKYVETEEHARDMELELTSEPLQENVCQS